jgi:hypothetical protein
MASWSRERCDVNREEIKGIVIVFHADALPLFLSFFVCQPLPQITRHTIDGMGLLVALLLRWRKGAEVRMEGVSRKEEFSWVCLFQANSPHKTQATMQS